MFHEEHYLPKYKRRIEISEGETPEILEACAIVRGPYFFSFCLHSIVRPDTLSKSKESGIIKDSSLFILSANCFSLSIYPLYLTSISTASIISFENVV